MKRTRKRMAVIALIIILALSLNVSAGQSTSFKDETVYGILDYNGSVDTVYVVNRLYNSDSNVYVDYGNYSEIKNLSTSTVPVIENDRITFNEKEVLSGGLYYQGTIDKLLPYKVNISYMVDGTALDGSELGGQSGNIEIRIQVEPDLYCEKAIRDGFMAQVTVNLNLKKVRNVVAEKATAVIAGNTMTLNFTVLANQKDTFSVSFDSENFELDPITVSLIKSSITLPAAVTDNISSFDEGFSQLTDGMNQLIEGTDQLQAGLHSLANGIGGVNQGMKSLSSNGSLLAGGLTQFEAGLIELDNAGNDIATGLGSLSENGTALNGGIAGLSAGMTSLSNGHEQLFNAASALIKSNDPAVRALAQGVIDEYEAIKTLEGSSSYLSSGINDYTSGIKQISDSYLQFNGGLNGAVTGLKKLTVQFNQYMQGVKSTSTGLDSLYNGAVTLPDEVKALNDGQIQTRDGITAFQEGLSKLVGMLTADNSVYVSFTSSKNKPKSVQYILTTKSIMKSEEKAVVDQTTTVLTFWERILNLFKF
ncbi:MAG: hypothetical protein JXQ23_06190 [Clostridia bacterium]|nr:hypothetical protein [Clostridia bacterium]